MLFTLSSGPTASGFARLSPLRWCGVGLLSLGVTLGAAAQTSARAVPKAVAPAAPVQPLSEAEQAVAAVVHVGTLPCELGQTVTLQPDQAAPGHFHLQTRTHRFHLRPVLTSTGAVRLEDAAQGAVWIQLSNKSMLMHQRLGRRLADECKSPMQQAVAEQLKHNPMPHLLDVAQPPQTERVAQVPRPN